jgi:hypothetical protein
MSTAAACKSLLSAPTASKRFIDQLFPEIRDFVFSQLSVSVRFLQTIDYSLLELAHSCCAG